MSRCGVDCKGSLSFAGQGSLLIIMQNKVTVNDKDRYRQINTYVNK